MKEKYVGKLNYHALAKSVPYYDCKMPEKSQTECKLPNSAMEISMVGEGGGPRDGIGGQPPPPNG